MAEAGAEQIVRIEPDQVPVHGYLHHAENSSDFLVLTHGAGGNCNAPLLVALASGFAAAGVNTLRCDLPFRQRRPSGPPSPSSAKQDQEGLRRALTLMRERFTGRAYLGGVSYGGRQASMLAASEAKLADGLLLLSYPLHPPGRAAQLRTQHFPELRTRTLFISGTRDAFGSIAELEAAIKLIPAPTRLFPIEASGHSLLTKSNREKLPGEIIQAFRDFFA